MEIEIETEILMDIELNKSKRDGIQICSTLVKLGASPAELVPNQGRT